MGVYRPPDQKVSKGIKSLADIISSMYMRPHFEVDVIGDASIDLVKSRDPDVKRYNDFIKRHDLVNIISEATCDQNDLKDTMLLSQ